jgi:hypothetical protein
MLCEYAYDVSFDARGLIVQVGGYSFDGVAMGHKQRLPRDAWRTLCLCQLIHRGIADLAWDHFAVFHHRKCERQPLVVVSYHLATGQRHGNPHRFEAIMRRPDVSVDRTEMLNARLQHEREGQDNCRGSRRRHHCGLACRAGHRAFVGALMSRRSRLSQTCIDTIFEHRGTLQGATRKEARAETFKPLFRHGRIARPEASIEIALQRTNQ